MKRRTTRRPLPACDAKVRLEINKKSNFDRSNFCSCILEQQHVSLYISSTRLCVYEDITSKELGRRHV